MENVAEYPDELQPLILQMFSHASGDGIISSTAQASLKCISRNCGYSKFEDFISAASEPILSTLIIDFHAVLISLPSNNLISTESMQFKRLETACRALTYFVEHSSLEAIHRMQPLVMQACGIHR